MKKFILILLVVIACGGEEAVEESNSTIVDATVTSTTVTTSSTTTTIYNADLAWDNFLMAWENNLKSELILTSSELDMTEELKKIWVWQGDKNNLNQYLFEIEVNGLICSRIYNSMGWALLDEIHPVEKDFRSFHTYKCDESGSLYLFGDPFYYQGDWWIFHNIDLNWNILDCNDPCGTRAQNYASKFKIDNPQDLLNNKNSSSTTKSKWESCNEDIYSDECGVEYNPTTEFFWGYSKFFIELREKITIWDKNSRTMLRNSEVAYPEELLPIMSSPVFDIEEFGETYNCYVYPMPSMVYYLRNYGYPQPLSSLENGEENFINWPEVYWLCIKEEIEFPDEIGGGFKDFNNGDFYLGQGPPVLRGDFGNRDPNPRYASWIMWGPSNPENDFDNDLKPVKEFNITKFYWWFGDGFNLLDLCLNTVFTYEKDYDFVCLDKSLNN